MQRTVLLLLPFIASVDSNCASFCNAYTCSLFSSCAGCTVCFEVHSGEYCAGWCNPYTSQMSYCHGCSSGHADKPDAPTGHFAYGNGMCRPLPGAQKLAELDYLKEEFLYDQPTVAACAASCKARSTCQAFEYRGSTFTPAQAFYLHDYIYPIWGDPWPPAPTFCSLFLAPTQPMLPGPNYALQGKTYGSEIDISPMYICARASPSLSVSGDVHPEAVFSMFEWYQGLSYATNVGACRTATGGGGTMKEYTVASGQECQRMCDADDLCVGFEISAYTEEEKAALLAVNPKSEAEGLIAGNCGIHTEPLRFTQSAGLLLAAPVSRHDFAGNVQCFAKADKLSIIP